MGDLVITVSQADISQFATGVILSATFGAAVGAGFVGLCRTLVHELWYVLRLRRRVARLKRREVARA